MTMLPCRASLLRVFLPLVLLGCAHVDERTAVEHEFEAERHRIVVAQAESRAEVEDVTLPVPSGSELAQGPGQSPRQITSGRAERELEIARRHEEAAQRIRQEAVTRCFGVPPEARSSCPLPTRARVEDIPGGVRLTPEEPLVAETLRVELDCAQAQARVERPSSEEEPCPLHVPGAIPRVIDRPEGVTIELVTRRASAVDELRRRVRRAGQGAGEAR